MKRKGAGPPRKRGKLHVVRSEAVGEARSASAASDSGDWLMSLWRRVKQRADSLTRRSPDAEEDEESELPEDAGSDVVLNILVRRESDRSYATDGPKIAGFVNSSAKNALRKRLRAARVRDEAAPRVTYDWETFRSSVGDPALELAFNELAAIVNRRLATMPPELARAWVMRRWERREVQWIAEHEGISESLASNRIFRAAEMVEVYVESQLNVQEQEKQS